MTASDPISHVQSVSAALTKGSPFTKIVDTWYLFIFIHIDYTFHYNDYNY